jgi:hypothetical protein
MQVETAFIIVNGFDGNCTATTNLEHDFEAERPALRDDIRIGCSEIARVIEQQEMLALVSQAIEQNSKADSQRISASMRDAVSRRKSTE